MAPSSQRVEPPQIPVRFTASAAGGCTIVSTFKDAGVATPLVSKTVTLTLSNADKGSNVWTCTSTAAQKYVPKTCAGV
ncbi:pilin [Variovorax sp. PAMC 28711]|uniref:pilin n=1 Tax=Variovorax sp. PAMC 28711 TaxID=1795631 RepID=UPI0009E7D119